MDIKLIVPLLPLDKSWVIRMGVLDLRHGQDTTINFLEKEPNLSKDLVALQRALKTWNTFEKIDVGESATLFRFLQFLSWVRNLGKEFVLQGTLMDRKITRDPEIINYSIEKLLTLDGKTSQWASAAVLCGNLEARIKNPPFKLALTYEAVWYWRECYAASKVWKPRPDDTIQEQARAFMDHLDGKSMTFVPQQAEDYCFARAFNLITGEEGLSRWPSLVEHESSRIIEMENTINDMRCGRPIKSKDHRVVQAIAMKAAIKRETLSYENPDCVAKSWPLFWEFMKKVV